MPGLNAAVALYRPGPMAILDDYIARSPVQFLFYDRYWIGDFDPRHPEEGHDEGLAAILRRLAAREEITLREVTGATDDWVVLKVIRD